MQLIDNQKPSRASNSRPVRSRLRFTLALPILLALPLTARAQNVEDEAIPDDVPAAVPDAPASQAPAAPAPAAPPTSDLSAPSAPPGTAAPGASTSTSAGLAADESVTVPRAVWEQLLRDVEELKRQRGAQGGSSQGNAQGANGLPDEVPPASADEGTGQASQQPGSSGEGGTAADGSGTSGSGGSGSRNYLLLPDISFNAQAKGRYSSDLRDEDRRRGSLAEAEIAIQGYVYPNVRAEAFIVAEPGEDVPFGLEQGFLDFLGIRKGLNIRVGRDFTPFGRTGRQHTHSWLYTRQLIPIRNIVASEELGGDGVSFSYLLPTRGKLYANATLGAYNGLSGGAIASSNPFGQDLPVGTGAGYNDRFYLGRLLLAHPVGSDGELELGGSYTRGRSTLDDDAGVNLGRGRVDLMGLDASYRKFFSGDRRLLLRSEYFRNTPSGGLTTRRASGYYGLANFRLDKFADVGLLYENSGFPQAPGARESALSLIYTKQLTEQFYIRLHGTRGNRPGQRGYNEATIQFTWGLGPHTHNLE